MKNLNYPGINTKFIAKHYNFLEVLTELSMILGAYGYYPSMDSREQKYAIINLAKVFCYNNQDTDWENTEFLVAIQEFADKAFIAWAKEEVLIKNTPFDKDDYVKISKIVKRLDPL